MAPKTTQSRQKRAVTTGAVLFDERLTEAALKLTDPLVENESQVREIFKAIAAHRVSIWDAIKADGQPAATFEFGDWTEGRRHLLRLCPKIAEYDRLSKSARDALLRDMNKLLFVYGETHLRVTASGLALTAYADSAASAAVRGLLPFMDPTYGWHPRRLYTCQLNTCGRWFLRPNQAGTVAMYCSTKHSNLARVRRQRSKA